MKLFKYAVPLLFTAATYALRRYANARRNASATASPAQPPHAPVHETAADTPSDPRAAAQTGDPRT